MGKSMISLDMFQAFANRFSVLSLIITCTFLGGCTSKSENQITEIITIPRIPSTFTDPPVSRDDVKKTDYSSQFDQLNNKKTILKSIQFGRIDPFQPPEDDNYSSEIPNGLFFTGIIKINGLVKAIITNENVSGTIIEGYIGTNENNLIPTGWLVKDIDEEREELVLTYQDKNLILSLQKI